MLKRQLELSESEAKRQKVEEWCTLIEVELQPLDRLARGGQLQLAYCTFNELDDDGQVQEWQLEDGFSVVDETGKCHGHLGDSALRPFCSHERLCFSAALGGNLEGQEPLFRMNLVEGKRLVVQLNQAQFSACFRSADPKLLATLAWTMPLLLHGAWNRVNAEIPLMKMNELRGPQKLYVRQLHTVQRKTLAWMANRVLEPQIKLPSAQLSVGDTGYWVDLKEARFKSGPVPQPVEFTCRGGLLLARHGMGKRRTTLGHALRALVPCPSSTDSHVACNAVLVICPRAACSRWWREALALEPSGKVVLLRSWHEFTQHCFADLLQAQVVILNVDLLSKQRYQRLPSGWQRIAREHIAQHLVEAGRFETWSPPFVEWLRWRCLIVDNVMELSTLAFEMVIDIHAEERWGLAGSLKSKVHLGTVRRLAKLLSGNRLPREPTATDEFLKQCTMRWPAAPIFPRVRERSYGILLSASEQCIYLSNANRSDIELCEDLYALRQSSVPVRVQSLALDNAAKQLEQSSDCLLELLEHRKSLCQELGEQLKRSVEPTGTLKTQLLESLGKQFADLANRCAQLEMGRAFIQQSIDALKEDEQRSCLLCATEDLPPNSFVIARCGHYCCVECMRKLLNNSPAVCPQCRGTLRMQDLFVLEEKRYSPHRQSKLAAVIHFVREKMPSSESLLLVCQRELFALRLCDALREHGVSAQYLDSHSHRAAAQVLLCSVEAGVPGCSTQSQAGYLAFAHPLQGERVELEDKFRAQLVNAGQKRKMIFTSHFVALGTLEDGQTKA